VKKSHGAVLDELVKVGRNFSDMTTLACRIGAIFPEDNGFAFTEIGDFGMMLGRLL
jgi:hypothetical protein